MYEKMPMLRLEDCPILHVFFFFFPAHILGTWLLNQQITFSFFIASNLLVLKVIMFLRAILFKMSAIKKKILLS